MTSENTKIFIFKNKKTIFCFLIIKHIFFLFFFFLKNKKTILENNY